MSSARKGTASGALAMLSPPCCTRLCTCESVWCASCSSFVHFFSHCASCNIGDYCRARWTRTTDYYRAAKYFEASVNQHTAHLILHAEEVEDELVDLADERRQRVLPAHRRAVRQDRLLERLNNLLRHIKYIRHIRLHVQHIVHTVENKVIQTQNQ